MIFHRSYYQFVRRVLTVASLVFAAGAGSLNGCSVCGCSLSADWAAQGYQSTPGFQAGVRYEYSDQTQLRTGSDSASRGSFSFPNADEIQQSTTNHATFLGLDYASAKGWGILIELPYIDRDHSTIVDGDTAASTSHASGVGDLRVLGRYQLFATHAQTLSMQLGVKLPTGRFDQTFSTGPQAGGLLDRGLQLGTGTTDVLTGVSYFARIGDGFGVFASALLDEPASERSDFRPSTSLGLNAGVRVLTTGWLTPQLQVNTRFDGREHGAQADVENSGGTFVYLSPGATVEFSERINAYLFVQVPVYQCVNGLQLEPKWLLSTGVSFKL